MQNKGYTIPELIIVVVVLGIISIAVISKASYAFENSEDVEDRTEELILTKTATAYGESIKDTLKKEKTKYVSTSDLVDAGFFSPEMTYKNQKIKIEYDEANDKISVKIMK